MPPAARSRPSSDGVTNTAAAAGDGTVQAAELAAHRRRGLRGRSAGAGRHRRARQRRANPVAVEHASEHSAVAQHAACGEQAPSEDSAAPATELVRHPDPADPARADPGRGDSAASNAAGAADAVATARGGTAERHQRRSGARDGRCGRRHGAGHRRRGERRGGDGRRDHPVVTDTVGTAGGVVGDTAPVVTDTVGTAGGVSATPRRS